MTAYINCFNLFPLKLLYVAIIQLIEITDFSFRNMTLVLELYISLPNLLCQCPFSYLNQELSDKFIVTGFELSSVAIFKNPVNQQFKVI